MSNVPQKIEILPAILPKSFEDLRALLSLMSGVSPVVQVDVVDGMYAPNKTWPYKGDQSFERIMSGDEGMPFWDTIEIEFDLMVSDPAEEVEKFVRAGAARIVVHGGSASALQALEKIQELRDEGAFNGEVGVAVPVDADVAQLEPFQTQFDYLQVMGIGKIGFQGQLFDERALSVIKDLHELYPEVAIQVDGGVSIERVGAMVRAGASRLIVGSAIFSSDNPARAYTDFCREANI